MEKIIVKEIKEFRDNRVWMTKKARINAEKRNLNYNVLSFIFLNAYTIAGVCFSIFLYRNPNELEDIANLMISIILFGIGLILPIFNFEKKANDFKQSYIEINEVEIELTDLINKIELGKYKELEASYKFVDLQKKYNMILAKTCNHKECDYLQVKYQPDISMYHYIYEKYKEKFIIALIWILIFIPYIYIIYKIGGIK